MGLRRRGGRRRMLGRTLFGTGVLAAGLLTSTGGAHSAALPTRTWVKSFGGYDSTAYGLAVAPNDVVYVVGDTPNTLQGETALGGSDAFVARYTGTGTRKWIRQFGTAGDDTARGVAVSGAAVFVAGSSSGSGFLARYSTSGTQTWTVPVAQALSRVAMDAGGNVLAIGRSVVYKFSPGGTLLWATDLDTATPGSDPVILSGLVVTGSDSIVVGALEMPWPDTATFGARLDSAGTVVWDQSRSPMVATRAVALDTTGRLLLGAVVPRGEFSIVSRTVGLDLTTMWSSAYMNSLDDYNFVEDVVGDPTDLDIFWTGGANHPDSVPDVDFDAWGVIVGKLHPDGARAWTVHFGFTGDDTGSEWGCDIAPNSTGSFVYVAGRADDSALLMKVKDPTP